MHPDVRLGKIPILSEAFAKAANLCGNFHDSFLSRARFYDASRVEFHLSEVYFGEAHGYNAFGLSGARFELIGSEDVASFVEISDAGIPFAELANRIVLGINCEPDENALEVWFAEFKVRVFADFEESSFEWLGKSLAQPKT